MKTIWKFYLEMKGVQTISIPVDSSILDVQMQGSYLQLWALVDPSKLYEHRYIRIYGTGHIIEDYNNLSYISTIQTESEVYHIFEIV